MAIDLHAQLAWLRENDFDIAGIVVGSGYLELVTTLVDELTNFKMRPPRIDPSDPETWREGQFDDLVFAVALAAWRASRHIPTPSVIQDHWREAREKASFSCSVPIFHW